MKKASPEQSSKVEFGPEVPNWAVLNEMARKKVAPSKPIAKRAKSISGQHPTDAKPKS